MEAAYRCPLKNHPTKKRYTTALFSYKEWNYVICRKMDGTNEHIKRNKLISQSQTWQVFSPCRTRRERGPERNRKLRYMEGGKGMEEEIKWKTTKMIKADYLPLWRCKGTPSFKHFFLTKKKKKGTTDGHLRICEPQILWVSFGARV